MVDPIADILNRIKNAQAISKETVEFPFSNLNYGIAKILEKSGFVKNVEKKKDKSAKAKNKAQQIQVVEIILKYKDNAPFISGLKRISKPGQRIYASFKDIKKAKGGYGVAIISTPKGLMTDREAIKQKLGGEMICKVW